MREKSRYWANVSKALAPNIHYKWDKQFFCRAKLGTLRIGGTVLAAVAAVAAAAGIAAVFGG
jgi:hypothetical protein